MGCIMSFLHSHKKPDSFYEKILKQTASAEQDIARKTIEIKTRINHLLDNLIKKRLEQLYELTLNNISESSSVAAHSAIIYTFHKDTKNICLDLSEDNIEKVINKLTLDDLCSVNMKKNIVVKYNNGLVFKNDDLIKLPTIDNIIDKLQNNDSLKHFKFRKGKEVRNDSSFATCIIVTW